MSYPGESSVDARVRAVEDDCRRRLSRLFVMFATVEAVVLVVLVAAVFVLELVDPEIGVWFIVAAAVVGASILSVLLMKHMRDRTTAVAQARGENPLF
ncbi:hypothetical protein [Microbacterium sp. SD291]|uniref:hypothetical protein n=1 Tax=Microbacterium sp. SD291 TaxID=2782007 RepID=UPI001A9587EE|nr:hypothetical protein [Microbacterium sp. SD291]MBO0980284.1 hypothetical protein [Microbacterium sp. SD291]